MKIKFNEYEKNIISGILEIFEGSGIVPYLVGGYVRNKLFNMVPKDFDIASSMLPEEIIKRGKEKGADYAGIVNDKLGTVLLIINGEKIEHTTFRKESYPQGGSHEPIQVQIGVNMQEDAFRRDFSVNALYADLRTGEILDPTERGLEDINLRRLRTTTPDPETVIKDDALRLLRLVRFACQFELSIDRDLWIKAKEYSGNILSVSKERLSKEMDGILLADAEYTFERKFNNGFRAVILLEELGLMHYLIPEFDGYRDIGYGDHHKYCVYLHTAHVVGNVRSDKILRYAALFHDVGKPTVFKETGKMTGHNIAGEEIAYKRMLSIGQDKKTSEHVSVLVREHMYDLNGEAKESKVRKKIQSLGYPVFEELIELRIADFIGSGTEQEPVETAVKFKTIMDRMKEENVPMSLKEMDIKGSDIINTYDVHGEAVGDTLEKLLKHCALRPQDNNRDSLIKEAGNILCLNKRM